MSAEQQKIWVLFVVGVLFCLGVAFALNRVVFIREKSDIFLRWYATTQLLENGRNIYDPQNGLEVSTQVYGDQPIFRVVNFYYPAHLLILIFPLALLSYPSAHFIWTTLVQIFYVAALWSVIRESRWSISVEKITLFLVLAMLFIPAMQHTIWGQFNTIGMVSLAMCYHALQNKRFAQAGMWAVGLTFKPHTTLLTLAFLLLWGLFRQERWQFLGGFGIVSLLCWGLTELLQPGWVFDFILSLGDYISTQSPLTQFLHIPFAGNVIVVGLTLIVLLLHRNTTADSPAFRGCLALTITVWALAVPTAGMMHVVVFVMTVPWLFSDLQCTNPQKYKSAIWGLVMIYSLGVGTFLLGLVWTTFYEQHILWTEFIYKLVLAVFLSMVALSFCLVRSNKDSGLVFQP